MGAISDAISVVLGGVQSLIFKRVTRGIEVYMTCSCPHGKCFCGLIEIVPFVPDMIKKALFGKTFGCKNQHCKCNPKWSSRLDTVISGLSMGQELVLSP